MLAFKMPMKILYDVPTVVLSLLAAIAASAVVLFTVSRRQMGLRQTVTGGVAIASGTATMHYIGMGCDVTALRGLLITPACNHVDCARGGHFHRCVNSRFPNS
jgi:hypothetical protein